MQHELCKALRIFIWLQFTVFFSPPAGSLTAEGNQSRRETETEIIVKILQYVIIFKLEFSSTNTKVVIPSLRKIIVHAMCQSVSHLVYFLEKV